MAYQHATVGASAYRSFYEDLISEFDLVYRNVRGYEVKYFPHAFPPEISQKVACLNSDATTWPISLQSRLDLLKWVDEFQRHLGTTRNKFVLHSIRGRHSGVLEPSLCLVRSAASKSDGHCCDAEVLVLGLFQSELASSQMDKAILRLCDVALRIFAARPERQFLHAFRLSKTAMEMWTFDRAGAYSSNAFDIVQEPHRFRNIIAEYMLMDDSGLGLNPAIQQDDEGAFLKLEGSDQPWGPRLRVGEEAFVKQDHLVGPGTTCFKAHIPGLERELVVKFAWEESEVSAEPKFLALANERDVWGLPKLEGYQFLGDIANFRQGLQFDQPYKFSLSRRGTESVGESGQLQLPESTSDSHASSANPVSSTVSNLETGTDKFCNLRLECVVTSPLGRPLDTFSSPSELMAVFRDIVRALRSLYLQAKILHRDISPQNIIIASHNTLNSDAPVWMLIDLDFALDLADPPSEQKMVGSSGFMAIGILGGDDHTYRHDLESLFYVFLWLAICHDGATSRHVPDTSRLHAWCGADFLAVFYQKRQDMQPKEFLKWIESEFTQPFRPYLPLATALHQLLFPMRNSKMFIGTDEEPDATERLHAGMVAAFQSYVG